MSVPIIGLHGRMGSGKDTVLERLQFLLPDMFVRVSFADKLKQSAAALLGVSVDDIERLKRSGLARIELHAEPSPMMRGSVLYRSMSIREYLQRYGTESHRDIFGDNFWVDQAMWRVDEWKHTIQKKHLVPVFTDVRFENEAHAIIERGGEIWSINGPVNDTGSHASETPLPVPLVDRFIDNTARDDAFAGLDAQLRSIIIDVHVGSRNEANPDRPHTDDRAAGDTTAGR